MRQRKRYGNPCNVHTNLSRRSGVRFLGEVSQTRSNHWEHIQKDKRAGGRTTRYGRSSHRHCSSLHSLSSSPPDAGKYAVPPQVRNLDSRSLTTPVDPRLLLESGRDVSLTRRGPFNQEENIRRLCPKPSKRGGTPHWMEGQTERQEGTAHNAGRVHWPRRLILLEQKAR